VEISPKFRDENVTEKFFGRNMGFVKSIPVHGQKLDDVAARTDLALGSI
jgi:hypothetical protein